jgi:hypothetical protein
MAVLPTGFGKSLPFDKSTTNKNTPDATINGVLLDPTHAATKKKTPDRK